MFGRLFKITHAAMIRTGINKWDWQTTYESINYRLPVTFGKTLTRRMYLCYISTAGNNFPGVAKVWGVHLQLVIATHHIIVDIPIKVTAQTTHPALRIKNSVQTYKGWKIINHWQLKRCLIGVRLLTLYEAEMWTNRRVPLSQLMEMCCPSSRV